MSRTLRAPLIRLLAFVAAFLMVAAPAWAQNGAESIEIIDINGGRYAEQGETQMVIELRNATSEPDTSAVEITADGEEVSDLVVQTIGRSSVPVGVVLVIDASGSMEGAPMGAAKTAAKAFISQAGSDDRIAVVSFADGVQVLSGFTSDKDALNAAINEIQPEGETAFNDGVIQGIELFDASAADDLLPHMIVLSDGEDTVSEASLEDATAVVGASEVRTFGVALESPDFNPDPVQQVAEAGGGMFFTTPDPGELSSLYGDISTEISNTLVAKFHSPISTAGEVEFGVSYQGLTASQTYAVSGFAAETANAETAAADEEAEATNTTRTPLTTIVVESGAALDLTTLMAMAAAGLGLTIFLFLVILFGRDDEDDPSRFDKRLAAYGRKGGPQEEGKTFLERLPFVRRFTQAAEEEVKRRGLLAGINSTLEQANIPISPGEAILAMLGLAAIGGVLAAVFNGVLWGLVTFAVLLLVVFVLLNFLGNRERRKFEDQLPDTLTLMSTSLRAGYSLLQATEAVSSEAQNPTAREFGRAITEARLGISVPDALSGIVDRTQSQDFEWAVMAIEIQREVGGNLAEVLQTTADTMRARNRLKGEIKA
ncbi:MAG TPA: VWA domain-containing protein, partial [Acidimicrobiia bacterium]|nr:VWA domain-containing protein [Acidimicrobiia bacterium]